MEALTIFLIIFSIFIGICSLVYVYVSEKQIREFEEMLRETEFLNALSKVILLEAAKEKTDDENDA